MTRIAATVLLLVAGVIYAQTPPFIHPRVLIVNLIPRSLSGEFQQDSEPFLAVSGTDPKLMAASAFTQDPFLGPRAPIFVSVDGGQTWAMNSMLPSAAVTADASIGFAGSTLYAGILAVERGEPMPHLKLLRTSDLLAGGPMRELMTKRDVLPDQPFVFTHAQTPRHLLMIGANVMAPESVKTATVFRALNSHAEPPLQWDNITVETRDTCRQDGPQVRTAISRDGTTAYAVFYQWTKCTYDKSKPNFIPIKANVVLLRDNLTPGVSPFALLNDGEDHLVGIRVAKDRNISWSMTSDGWFGSERVGGDLALAVDPREANIAYIVWSESNDVGKVNPTLHVMKVIEGGARFEEIELAKIPNSKNPGIAVASDGTIGLLYQSLQPGMRGGEWATHFRWTRDDFRTSRDIVLAQFKDGNPSAIDQPYLGDYLSLVAVGNEFRGVFSSANRPDRTRFLAEASVKYQRRVDWDKQVLLASDGVTKVQDSIDPFFVQIRFEPVVP